MLNRQHWDWDTDIKKIPFSDWTKSYHWVEEPQASLDGEKVAAIVNINEGEFSVCINGDAWESVFEKIWYLRFTPGGQATALVSEMGEWTVAVDGIPWENRYGYVWGTRFGRDGKEIAVAVQQEMKYGMAINDAPWETTYTNMTDPTLSCDGRRTAAAVQRDQRHYNSKAKQSNSKYMLAAGVAHRTISLKSRADQYIRTLRKPAHIKALQEAGGRNKSGT